MESPNNLLTTKDCDTILQNCFKQNDFKVTSYTIKSLSDKVEGFLGDHFFVILDYEDNEGTSKSQRYFMKVLNGSDLIFKISECLNAYNKEKFFYTFLLSEFQKYGIETTFSPKGYFCKPYLLVLEDLSQQKFVGYPDRARFLDLDHCKIGLKTLAKLHSAGLVYEAAKSSEQGSQYCIAEKFPEMFQDVLFVNDNNLARQWLERSLEGIFALIPVISEDYKLNQDEFKTLLSRALQNSADYVNYVSKFKGTILHGDLWFNNFMFQYDGSKVTNSVLIDYQLLKYGPPSVDVLHFIFANTRKNIRDVHFDELVQYYFNELNAILSEHGLDSHLPKDQYLQLCKELQLVLKLQCICDRSVTLLVDDSDDAQPNDDTFRANMFNRQTDAVISCYNKHAFFKDVMAEDMIELYNMLTNQNHTFSHL